MEKKKEERSLAERACRNEDPEMEKLKQAILALKGFKDGLGMNEYQIEKALKDENCMFPTEEKFHMALMDLCNCSKLLRPALVLHEGIHNKLVAHTYWPEKGFIEIPVEEIVKQTKEEEKDETKLIEETVDEKRESS